MFLLGIDKHLLDRLQEIIYLENLQMSAIDAGRLPLLSAIDWKVRVLRREGRRLGD